MAYSSLMQILTDPIARQDIAIGQTGLEGPIDGERQDGVVNLS
jgi:hypothetical protein